MASVTTLFDIMYRTHCLGQGLDVGTIYSSDGSGIYFVPVLNNHVVMPWTCYIPLGHLVM